MRIGLLTVRMPMTEGRSPWRPTLRYVMQRLRRWKTALRNPEGVLIAQPRVAAQRLPWGESICHESRIALLCGLRVRAQGRQFDEPALGITETKDSVTDPDS